MTTSNTTTTGVHLVAFLVRNAGAITGGRCQRFFSFFSFRRRRRALVTCANLRDQPTLTRGIPAVVFLLT